MQARGEMVNTLRLGRSSPEGTGNAGSNPAEPMITRGEELLQSPILIDSRFKSYVVIEGVWQTRTDPIRCNRLILFSDFGDRR